MLYNIQALRGIAALLVLFHHSLPHFKAMNLSSIVFENVAKFGFIGVDIFFVISGFVMAKTTIGKPQGLYFSGQFILKRFLRIFLGFWPIMILSIIYLYLFNSTYLEDKLIFQSFFLINTNMFKLVIPPAWSLTYELYFYLIIALLIFLSKSKPHTFFGIIILSILIKLVIVPLEDNRYLNFFFSSLIFEFIAGYYLCYFLEKLCMKKYFPILIILAVIVLYLAIKINVGYGPIRTATYGVFAFLIVWFFVSLERNKILILKGLFKSIGDSSYTLYLTHTVLLGMFFTLGLRDYFVSINFAFLGFIIYIVSIVLFSWVFYKIIEHPLYIQTKERLIKS